MAAETKNRRRMKEAAEEGGVFDYDAPDGYVGLVVYATNGRLLLRVEIAEDCFSYAWLRWLEQWFRRWDPRCIRLLR